MSYRTYIRPLAISLFSVLFLIESSNIYSDQTIISKHNYSLYKGNILFGKSSYILNLKDNIYSFEIKSQTDGIFELKQDDRLESSKFIMDKDQILPIEYKYIRKRKKKEEYITTIFNSDTSSYTLIDGIKKDHINSLGSQDRLSVQIAFQEDMKKGIFESTYNVIDKGRSRKYIFTIHGDDIIDTVFGKTNAIVIKRIIENNKRSTLTWYAVDHDYVPVRIEQYRKESLKFTVMLEEIIK